MAIASSAQTFTTLFQFDGTDGSYPGGSLVQGFDGNFYGTTFFGGVSGGGSIFKISPAGELTHLYTFCSTTCPEGAHPQSGLVLGIDGNFYGTTSTSENDNGGTVFEVTPSGQLTTLYYFCSQTKCLDGKMPYAPLVLAANGDFYGTTGEGGSNNAGTVFKITPTGELTTLYSFCDQPSCADGGYPFAGLIQATDGNFYGTTYRGGVHHGGTVFEITSAGKLTTLYTFCSQSNCTDGEYPYAGLIQASDGNFYGTAYGGGANSDCVMGCGTIFKITSAGQLTTVYNFCAQSSCTDGEHPYAGLTQATDGNFYGTTVLGGSDLGQGVMFEITPSGKYTNLHTFCTTSSRCQDGFLPYGGVMQATNGNFYGTVQEGGRGCSGFGCGTIFGFANSLRAFLETLPTSGNVGTQVVVLGYGLTNTTSVTFNGIPATYTVVSATEITTTVPAGATTGRVQVTLPTGTLSSNVVFRVRP